MKINNKSNEVFLYVFVISLLLIIPNPFFTPTKDKTKHYSKPMISSKSIDDAGEVEDAGDTFGDALLVGFEPFNGTIGYDGDLNDYYRFSIQQEGIISVNLQSPNNSDFDLFLYNPNNNIKSSDYSLDLNKYVQSNVDGEYGYWRVRISCVKLMGTYNVTISFDISEQIMKPQNLWILWSSIGTAIFLFFLITIILILKKRNMIIQRKNDLEDNINLPTSQTVNERTDEDTLNREYLSGKNKSDEEKDSLDNEFSGYSFDNEIEVIKKE